jgi:nicotinate phosphoribosyltransferase
MQVTSKRAGWVSGVDESIALLKLCADDWAALTVHALFEGDRCEPWDAVLTIEGPYEGFAHLETLYLGTLGRRTMICTNARLCKEAARS